MSFSKYLKRIQNLPLIKRKIIFWAIITIFGLILFALYILNVKQKIKTFPIKESLEELKLPELEKGLENLPKFETEGKLEEVKENIKETEGLIDKTQEQ